MLCIALHCFATLAWLALAEVGVIACAGLTNWIGGLSDGAADGRTLSCDPCLLDGGFQLVRQND